MDKKLKVVVETPYSGDIEKNVEYLLRCMHDSYFNKNEAPIASHLLYTRLPKNEIKGESYQGHVQDSNFSRHGRKHGIDCGFLWNQHADKIVVYTDNGITNGMKQGIKFALEYNIKLEYRKLN